MRQLRGARWQSEPGFRSLGWLIAREREDVLDDVPKLAAPGTVVLLGAGASVDAGLPTSLELHEQLTKTLPQLYSNLAKLVFAEGEDIDPERLFRVLEFLHVVETGGRPYDRRPVTDSPDVARLVKSWDSSIEEYLEYQKDTVRGGSTGRVIDGLWKALADIFLIPMLIGERQLGYLLQLVSAMRGQTIVTLNYDNAIEVAMSQAFAFSLDDDPRPRPTQPWFESNRSLRLIRLHGSLQWRRERRTGDVRVLSSDEVANFTRDGVADWDGDTPGVIFGGGNKLRPDGPYLDLYYEFRAALAEARQVVVIGYSFRDAHVNEALRRWFLSAQEGSVLRLSRITSEIPTVVLNWGDRRQVDLQLVAGPVWKTISRLVGPSPRLLGNENDDK